MLGREIAILLTSNHLATQSSHSARFRYIHHFTGLNKQTMTFCANIEKKNHGRKKKLLTTQTIERKRQMKESSKQTKTFD